MSKNPTLHHRRSIRLKGYDYSQEGLYFITICVQNRISVFGDIIQNQMILNDYGKIAEQCWLEIPFHFPNVNLHEFVVMPNHIHGIIEIVGANDVAGTNDERAYDVGAKNFSPLPPPPPSTQTPTPFHSPSKTIGSIVRGFKIGVVMRIKAKIWQRNYYEHIIRDTESDERIAKYILENPQKWNEDKFFQ